MQRVKHYTTSWDNFELYCTNKAKGRCHLNNSAWRKLREYHLDNYLKDIDNPFGLLFNIKTFHKDLYKSIRCMPKYYYRYAKKRTAEFQEDAFTKYKRIVKQKRKEKIVSPGASR